MSIKKVVKHKLGEPCMLSIITAKAHTHPKTILLNMFFHKDIHILSLKMVLTKDVISTTHLKIVFKYITDKMVSYHYHS